MTDFNKNNEISELTVEELDAIVGGDQCGGGTDWGYVGRVIKAGSVAVGNAILGGAGFAVSAIVLQTKQ